MALNKKENYRYGHRERLRKKFLGHKSSLADYELLELALFYVFPRIDTKERAKSLLDHFKTLRNIIFADPADIKKIPGIKDSSAIFFKLIHEILCRIEFENLKDAPIIASSEQVIQYYQSSLENLKKEQLRVMFLNNKNRLLAEEVIQTGTVNQTPFYPREIIQKALEHGASALILVHNHPSGDPQPSRQDIVVTKQLLEIAQKLDIMLLDHLIIGKSSYRSFRESNII